MGQALVGPTPPGQNNGQQQQQQQPSIWQVGMRMMLMYYVFTWLFGGNKQKLPSSAISIQNSFKLGELFDLRVYLSEGRGAVMSHDPQWKLYWEETEMQLAQDSNFGSIVYQPSESVKTGNGSVWMSLHISKSGYPNDPDDDMYDPNAHFVEVLQLNKYGPQPKVKAQINLLSGEIETKDIAKQEQEGDEDEEAPWLSYWKPNITISMVNDFKPYQVMAASGLTQIHGLPPQINKFYRVNAQNGIYYPLIWMNEFWLLHDHLIPINASTEVLTLNLQVAPLSHWLFNLMISVDHSFEIQKTNGLIKGEEADEFKRILLEGNPILLGITFLVSMLHMVFDFLAFKSDIGFWHNNKSMEGLSANVMVINAFCSLIVTLYLFDNETSFVVLISTVLETAIAFWKITKAYDISTKPTFPFLSVKDRSSYVESNTKQYDKEATRYLSYVLFPLVLGYSVYSLIYQQHKSWYSYIVTSLVGAVYMFGFILMCPQLYLNYKLKSVAHLPWRQMSYKFLNTIIDDLFAFVIKMPILHRLSVFRDDLVFLVYLYQRWIYPVDKTRVNEFGYVEQAQQSTQPTEQITQPSTEGEVSKEAEDSKEEKEEEKASNTLQQNGEKIQGDKESKKDQ